MRIAGRDPRRVLSAVLRRDHYAALFNIFRHHTRPAEFLMRYLSGRGAYPWNSVIRTPTGIVSIKAHSSHDVLTINEVFFRRDYGKLTGKVYVDIGANVGIASLYFLSLDSGSFVYAAEPVPRNLERLRENLGGFSGRISIETSAVSTEAGAADFVVEPIGRYGGLADFSTRSGETISVECVSIGSYLNKIVLERGFIDLVKIDTEGNERVLVDAIPESLKSKIGCVIWENNDGTTRYLEMNGPRA